MLLRAASLLLLLLLHTTSCAGYNVVVVGEVGTGKSRLINAVMRHMGVSAQPAVAGNKLTKKGVTRRLHRYCAESEERYYCWYDTPGMDVCDCLAESSQETESEEPLEDSEQPQCAALTRLNELVSGSIRPGSTEVLKPSPAHSADVLLFASQRSGPQSAACGRRILQHLQSNSITIPVVVALTGGHSSVGLSFGGMHIVTIHNLFDTNTEHAVAPLMTLLSNFRENETCHETIAHQSQLSSLAEKESTLEDSKERLKKEITDWEDEKNKRQDTYKQISSQNYELAERILLVGVYCIGIAMAVRIIHFMFTTGVVVANNTQKWSKVAAIRLMRLAHRYLRRRFHELISLLKQAFQYLFAILKQLSFRIRNGTLFTFATLKSVLIELMRLFKKLILYGLGCIGSSLLFCLRLFPSLWKSVNAKVVEYRAEREARKLEERGIRDAKVCGSCMTHLGVQKASVVSQTDDNDTAVAPMESTASLSADDTLTQYPYEMKYRDNIIGSSPSPEPEPQVQEPVAPPAPAPLNNTSRPKMKEPVQVIWTDGVIYPGVVSALPEDGSVGITWDDKSNGSYSVVPINRIIRFTNWERFMKYVRPLYSWMFRWKFKFQFVANNKQSQPEPPARSITPPEWDFRKFDPASPGRGRRNSLPVIRNTEVDLPDFKKESEVRIESARCGQGRFMDPVGAPLGTSFNDVCFAADHLQSSLTKTLAASMERDDDDAVAAFEAESVVRSQTPKQMPPTPATAERIILSPPPGGSDAGSPRSPRFRTYDSTRSPDIYNGKLLSPAPLPDESRYLQAGNSRRYIPPMRTSKQVFGKPSVSDLPTSRRSSVCTPVIKSPRMSSVFDELTDCGDDAVSEKESTMTVASSRKMASLGLSRQHSSKSTPRQRPVQGAADPLTPIYSGLEPEQKEGLWGFVRGIFGGSKSPPEREPVPIKRRTSFDTSSLPRPSPPMGDEGDFNSRRKPSLMRTNSTASRADQWERYSSYISGGDQWNQPTPVVEPAEVDPEPEPGIPHAMSVSSTGSISVESSEDIPQTGVVGWVTSLVRPPAHSLHRMLRKTQQDQLYEEFQKRRNSAHGTSIGQLPSTYSLHREPSRRSRSITSTIQLPTSSPSAQTTTDLLGETLPDQSWKRFHQPSASVLVNPALGSRKSSRVDFPLTRRAQTPEI